MKTTLVLAFALVVAGPATAGGFEPWVSVSGGFNGYDMSAVNDGIRSLNNFIAPAKLDPIRSQFGYGAAFGVERGAWSFGLAWDRLAASTTTRSSFAGELGYDVPANVFVARAVYTLPASGWFRLGFGAGAGVVHATGHFGIEGVRTFAKGAGTEAQIAGPLVQVRGTDPCAEAFLQGEVALGSRFALVPAAGWRFAKVDATQKGSQGQVRGDFDYTGWSARVGLKLGL